MRCRFASLWWSALLIGVALAGCSGGNPTATPGTALQPVNPPPPVTVQGPYAVSDLPLTDAALAPNDLITIFNSDSRSEVSYSLGTYAPTAQALTRSSTPTEPADAASMLLRRKERQLTAQYGTPRPLLVTRATPAQSRNFYVLNFDTNHYSIVNATLRYTSARSYIYVADSANVSNLTIARMADAWETNIYPTTTGAFGTPSDIDSNGRVVILITPIASPAGADYYIAGYFDPTDMYSRDRQPYSNEGELLYVNDRALGDNSYDFGVLPHELQHLINFNYKHGNEWISLNEGLSMLSMDLCGYGMLDGTSDDAYYKVQLYEETPERYPALTDDYNDFGLGHYGAALLFTTYLYDRFGASAIKELVTGHPGKYGPENLQLSTGASAAMLVHDWALANLLDNTGSDPKYDYTSLRMKGNVPLGSDPLPGVRVYSLLDIDRPLAQIGWSAAYYHAPQAMSLTIMPQSSDAPVSAIHLTAP